LVDAILRYVRSAKVRKMYRRPILYGHRILTLTVINHKNYPCGDLLAFNAGLSVFRDTRFLDLLRIAGCSGKPARIAAVFATLLIVAGCEHAMLEDTIFDAEYTSSRHLPNEEKVSSAPQRSSRPLPASSRPVVTAASAKSSVTPMPQKGRTLSPERLLRP
jgi:hypothetical protein